MTKIFEVRIAMYAVVAADNENHAYEVARRNASSILSDDGNPYIDVLCEAKTLQDLGNGWNGDCLPYGGDGKTTLSKLLKSNAQVHGRPAVPCNGTLEQCKDKR